MSDRIKMQRQSQQLEDEDYVERRLRGIVSQETTSINCDTMPSTLMEFADVEAEQILDDTDHRPLSSNDKEKTFIQDRQMLMVLRQEIEKMNPYDLN